MLKTIFSRWTLKDEVQGTVSRLERERLQIVLHMIEADAKRTGIENKLAFLRGWLNPAPAQAPNAPTTLESEQKA